MQAVETAAAAPTDTWLPAPKSRRILIIALNYAPELVGCAKYTTELAEYLVRRGHAVQVIAGPPYYPAWRIEDGYSGATWSTEVRSGVVVHRTPLYVPNPPKGFRRVLHLASFGLAALPTALHVGRRFRPQVVLGVAPTLASASIAALTGRLFGAASWLHVQDFEVDAAFDLGLMTRPLTRRIALGAERALLRAFDRVSSISPAMVRRLAAKGVGAERAVEFRNWADVDGVQIFASSNTRYRRELDIAPERLVALYSGNMAAKQGIETLALVAARLQEAGAPVTLVLCGDGPARAGLEAACAGRDNVRFLPLQPLDRLAELLGTADVHLLPQRAEAADLVLPSKLCGMLASGRPVVAMAQPGTGLAEEVEGCGLCVAPDAEAMTAALIRLAGDPDQRQALGHAARRRAEDRWHKSAIIDELEARMQDLVAMREAAAG